MTMLRRSLSQRTRITSTDVSSGIHTVPPDCNDVSGDLCFIATSETLSVCFAVFCMGKNCWLWMRMSWCNSGQNHNHGMTEEMPRIFRTAIAIGLRKQFGYAYEMDRCSSQPLNSLDFLSASHWVVGANTQWYHYSLPIDDHIHKHQANTSKLRIFHSFRLNRLDEEATKMA